eukprot:Polyplicarium_translucidae@DN3180_c0_g1_i1.p1
MSSDSCRRYVDSDDAAETLPPGDEGDMDDVVGQWMDGRREAVPAGGAGGETPSSSEFGQRFAVMALDSVRAEADAARRVALSRPETVSLKAFSESYAPTDCFISRANPDRLYDETGSVAKSTRWPFAPNPGLCTELPMFIRRFVSVLRASGPVFDDYDQIAFIASVLGQRERCCRECDQYITDVVANLTAITRSGFHVTISDPDAFAARPKEACTLLRRLSGGLSRGSAGAALSLFSAIVALSKNVDELMGSDDALARDMAMKPRRVVEFMQLVLSRIEQASRMGICITPTPVLMAAPDGHDFFRMIFPGALSLSDDEVRTLSNAPHTISSLLTVHVMTKLGMRQAAMLGTSPFDGHAQRNLSLLRRKLVDMRSYLGHVIKTPMIPTRQEREVPWSFHVYHPAPVGVPSLFRFWQGPDSEHQRFFAVHGDRQLCDRMELQAMAEAAGMEHCEIAAPLSTLSSPQWALFRLVDHGLAKENIAAVMEDLLQCHRVTTELAAIEKWGSRTSLDDLPPDAPELPQMSDVRAVQKQRRRENREYEFLAPRFRKSFHLRLALLKLSASLSEHGVFAYPLRPDSGFSYSPNRCTSAPALAGRLGGPRSIGSLFFRHVVDFHRFDVKEADRIVGEFSQSPCLMFARWNFLSSHIQLQHVKSLRRTMSTSSSTMKDCDRSCLDGRPCLHSDMDVGDRPPPTEEKNAMHHDFRKAEAYLRLSRFAAAKTLTKLLKGVNISLVPAPP